MDEIGDYTSMGKETETKPYSINSKKALTYYNISCLLYLGGALLGALVWPWLALLMFVAMYLCVHAFCLD